MLMGVASIMQATSDTPEIECKDCPDGDTQIDCINVNGEVVNFGVCKSCWSLTGKYSL